MNNLDCKARERSKALSTLQKKLNELHEDLKHEFKVSKALRDVVTELEKENKELKKENEQLKHFIQELATKGTGKIHLANGNIYKVNAILTDFKR